MNILPPIAEMERAYLKRDPAYNGLFFVGVRTTDGLLPADMSRAFAPA